MRQFLINECLRPPRYKVLAVSYTRVVGGDLKRLFPNKRQWFLSSRILGNGLFLQLTKTCSQTEPRSQFARAPSRKSSLAPPRTGRTFYGKERASVGWKNVALWCNPTGGWKWERLPWERKRASPSVPWLTRRHLWTCKCMPSGM